MQHEHGVNYRPNNSHLYFLTKIFILSGNIKIFC